MNSQTTFYWAFCSFKIVFSKIRKYFCTCPKENKFSKHLLLVKGGNKCSVLAAFVIKKSYKVNHLATMYKPDCAFSPLCMVRLLHDSLW